jgi:lysyl-tRNA synthetase class I
LKPIEAMLMDDQLDRSSDISEAMAVHPPASTPPLARYTRRLSDKIMAAFTHAYAIGAVEVAERLRALLSEIERKRTGQARRDTRAQQPPILDQAARWIEFVDARNRYRKIIENQSARATEQRAALSAMKEAYRRWSEV